ncbi:WD repeat-containing protein 36 [Chironomus tepperi]|uniref:WD repeat-containing protein 36 n=1 Tax=Chironomus tepperi TaxID=113505 RepID=UPI00391F901A
MSKIFQQNRALGYVSNQVPATVRYVTGRKENLVTTCVGKSFITISCTHFRLLTVSGLHPDEITCLASDKFLIYSACGSTIYGWRRGNEIKHKYVGHKSKVTHILPFGNHIISVDEDSLLKVWDKKSECLYTEIPFQNESFKITAVMHPHTYVNKILLGSEQGTLQLWNVRHGKLIYTFSGFTSKITVLEQSPAIDVIAVGMSNGQIALINIKVDKILMEFTQEWGMVTGIAFRTDGPTMMATSSINGQIAFWDLEEKKIVSTLLAHHDSVSTLRFLPNEPLLLTTSIDNSLKLWIFDKLDGTPRLLRYREGHSSPPLCIRYHGSKGDSILSAGEDSSLRIFSTISETLNASLGRASYNRKASKKINKLKEDHLLMPPITSFTSEMTREKHWDSIVAIHNNLVEATTWSFDKRKMGDIKLMPERFKNSKRKDFKTFATSLTMTHCGNFVIIGYSSGDIERYNMQSGIHRATYGSPAHSNDVRGVYVDNLNQFVISAGIDTKLKFWNFKTKEAKDAFGEMKLQDSILFIRGHRESSMLCVVLEDFTVLIIDYDTKTIVRKFVGHSAPITDACFSPDSRWLITSSMDCTVKVWDIPSSYLIDHFKMSQPCISLSMSPTGDFLATAHVDFLGVYLWANKTLYEHISLRSINPENEAPSVELPNMLNFEHKYDIVDAMNLIKLEPDEDDEEGEYINLEYKSPFQIDDDLITMSSLTEAKWKNLLDLDIIKKRNRPKEAPKKPKQAPFFLPTVAGLEMAFNVNGTEQDDDHTKLKSVSNVENLTTFGVVLKKSSESNDYTNSINHFVGLNPSMIDYEVRSLAPLGGGSISLMDKFLKMIVEMFKSNKNFELAQSYLALFLKSHEEIISGSKILMTTLDEIETVQNKCWSTLEEQLMYSIGVVSNLRNYC